MPTFMSAASAEHYTWGGPNGTECDGWHLVKALDFSIIEERMPPGTNEVRHSHARARQFFYVLEGVLTIEIEKHEFCLGPGQGIEVAPSQPHQAINRDPTPARFLVVNRPPSHGDRENK